jgi:hypothetical protein
MYLSLVPKNKKISILSLTWLDFTWLDFLIRIQTSEIEELEIIQAPTKLVFA